MTRSIVDPLNALESLLAYTVLQVDQAALFFQEKLCLTRTTAILFSFS